MVRRWGRRSAGSTLEVDGDGADCERSPDDSKRPRLPSPPADGRPADKADLVISRGQAVARHAGRFRVWWIEKGGQRHDRSLALDDELPPEDISEAAREYQLRIKASFLQSKGRSKEEVAKELSRAAGWVSLWWKKAPAEVPRPREVPPYIAEYNLRMLELGIEPYRPAMLRRRYVEDTAGLYLECAQQMPWRQAVFRKRNYETGEVTVTNIASSRQDCAYPSLFTGIPRLDEALDRIRRDFDIADPRAYLLNNFYPDGNTSIAPHNHDFWSAILSFGASRVFTLDGVPILLGDGDLLILGTQRHGVPKMPAVKDGRVSIAIFWYPENRRELETSPGYGACAQCGQIPDVLQESTDGSFYCEACWQTYRASQSGHQEAANLGEPGDSDDDLLAAALELSLNEF